MSRNTRLFACSPEDVFRVLADGWQFPSWVVGSTRMRDVASDWPLPGARLQHSFGVWPVLIDDATTVLEFDPPHRLVLKARGWPIGEALIEIQVKSHPEGALVRIQEEALTGPGRLIPRPILDLFLHPRNAETLHRLAYLAEGQAARPARETTADAEGAAA